jgi:hypothetical protein
MSCKQRGFISSQVPIVDEDVLSAMKGPSLLFAPWLIVVIGQHRVD